MKKYLLFVLVCYILLQNVIAVPPVLSTIKSENGLDLSPSLFTAVKQNTTRDFYIHVFNRSNGLPIYPNSVSCSIHIYDELKNGDHIYINRTPYIKEINDYEFNIPGSVFEEKGIQTFKVWCNNSNEGGYYESAYYVTGYGLDPAQLGFKVFIYVFFIIILFLSLYFTFMNIAKLALIDTTILDVILSWCVYFGLIISFYLSRTFLIEYFIEDLVGNIFFNIAGAMILGLIPLVSLIITMIKKSTEKKKPISIEELTGRRLLHGY